MIDVEQLLEKYYADLRHIETERHWFLGSYAVVVEPYRWSFALMAFTRRRARATTLL